MYKTATGRMSCAARAIVLAICFLAFADASANVKAKSSRKRAQVPNKKAPNELTALQTMASGGLARMVAQMALYPLDTMRTLAQTRSGAKTLAELGTATLIRGCTLTSIFALPVGGIQFFTHGKTKKLLLERERQFPAVLVDLQASICAACASLVFTIPQDVIKQRLQTGIFPSFRVGVKNLWKEEGIRGFYAAALPTAARNVPFVVITFTSFSLLEKKLLERKEEAELTGWETLCIGIGSALFAGVITQPIDVIKTRLTTQAATNLKPYSGILDCVQSMWKDEGFTAFYAGLAQRSAYMGPLWALQFTANGRIKKHFQMQNSKYLAADEQRNNV